MDDCRRAREAAADGEWEAAYRAFERMADDGTLGADDLALWSTAGYLLGRVDGAIDAMSKAHDAHINNGDVAAAIRCGFWVVFMLLGRGQHAQASGWLARCGHDAEPLSFESAARGYLTLTRAQQMVAIEHRYDEGGVLAEQVVGLARCGRDPDLLALALMIAGRAGVRAGETHGGFAMLDEAMVSVVRDEVSPIVTGTVYCAVIEACEEVSELRRAVEWTQALVTWCDRQRGMVTFTGRCRTHRAAVLMLQGDWDAAVAEANSACASFAGAADEAAVGEAHYLLAELHRLAGRDALAELAYRRASEWGREPQYRETAIAFVAGVLDRLGLDRCQFVTNSMGSLWSLWLAQQQARVEAQVMIGCPAMFLGTSAPAPMRLASIPWLGRRLLTLREPSAEQVERVMAMVGEKASGIHEIRDMLLACERLPAYVDSMLGMVRSVMSWTRVRREVVTGPEQLRAIEHPVQVIWGEDDPFGTVQTGRRIAELIPGSGFAALPGGHAPWFHHADQIATITREFLAAHLGPARPTTASLEARHNSSP